MKHLLTFAMLLSLIGNLVVIIAFGCDMITLAQTIVSLAAFTVIGYAAAHDL